MKVTVLIADDEAEVAARVRTKVREAGFTVCEVSNRRPDECYARDGAEALELAAEARPDIVLMDINMERPLDGIEAGSVIMSSLNIPVVYVTAYGDPGTVNAALESHPYGFLPKSALDDVARLKVTVQMAIGLNNALKEKARFEADHAKLAMAQAVAHDLNNFIAQIEASMMTTEDALRDVKSLAGVMMDYAEQLEPADLGNIVWNLRYHYNDSHLKDARVIFVPPLGETWVNGSPTSIKRLLSNLIHNAIRHGSRPGMVVRVRVLACSGVRERPDSVRLEVADTGKGISDDVLHKLTSREVYTSHVEGHGIGFSNVWKIVDSHGATLSIDTTVGRGTSIAIDFPPVQSRPSIAPELEKPHILVVEDEETLCQLAEMILGDAGYRVTSTAMAEAALDIVADDSTVLLVITDRNLTGKLDGLELAHRLRKDHANVSVLLTSGDSSEVGEDGRLYGFPFLSKTSQREHLVRQVSKCLENRR